MPNQLAMSSGSVGATPFIFKWTFVNFTTWGAMWWRDATQLWLQWRYSSWCPNLELALLTLCIMTVQSGFRAGVPCWPIVGEAGAVGVGGLRQISSLSLIGGFFSFGMCGTAK